jgi:hypothetical protein
MTEMPEFALPTPGNAISKQPNPVSPSWSESWLEAHSMTAERDAWERLADFLGYTLASAGRDVDSAASVGTIRRPDGSSRNSNLRRMICAGLSSRCRRAQARQLSLRAHHPSRRSVEHTSTRHRTKLRLLRTTSHILIMR